MVKNKMKIIGIMGGMGPEATVDLYSKIIEITKREGAKKDQDHIETIISSVPQTPDRTQAIFGKAESPVPYLIKSAKRLEKAGADFIVIPCNTSHHFLNEIKKSVGIPILSMMEEVRKHIKEKHPDLKIVGLLATDGTIKTELYQKELKKHEIDVLAPDGKHQKLVMDAIYGSGGIKEGAKDNKPKEKLKEAAKYLIGRGAELIIMGCTEIPLALKQEDVKKPLIDATYVLAEAAVEKAMSWNKTCKL